MPNLRNIISIINNSLQSGNFASRPFQSGSWLGLANIVSRIDEVEGAEVTVKRPAVFDLTGEGVDVTPDDTYPIRFYHRLASPLQYPDDPPNSFGQPGHDTTEVAEMILICIGDTNRIGVFAEDVCAGTIANMRSQLSDGQLTANGLDSCSIDVQDTNTDTEKVFAQEYQGVQFTLKPSMFMISVRYTITSVYSKACFKLC